MNSERKVKKQIASIINVIVVYLISGALIMYGGVNLSLNGMEMREGMYTGHWWVSLPFLFCVGLLPVIAGIALLVLHPATATKKRELNESQTD